MNARDRFNATLRYDDRDRCPAIDLGFWDECLDLWRDQGLPAEVNAKTTDAYFGMEGFMRYYVSPEATDGSGLVDRGMIVPEGVRVGLTPLFPERVLEDHGDQEVVQKGDGTRVRRHRRMSSIPVQESHRLCDRKSWENHYQPRLNSESEERFPVDWSGLDRVASDRSREHLLILPGGSLYGWIRNWMGMEAVSYLIYDDPALFEEMLETICNCIHGSLTRVLERGGSYDACLFWEDLAYNAGPLISPARFEQFIVPRYRCLTDLLRRHGVEHLIVDSDGRIDAIIPLWLDAGVNTILPLEIGTTGADPIEYRKRFGRDLRIIGGFDKRILAESKRAIEREVDRLTPMVEEGGFIPTCDHKVPPDVALEHYRYYLELARERWVF